MREELNLLKALEVTKALWTWLAKTGRADKYNWPGWTDYPGFQSGASCPCCAYTESLAIEDPSCDHCPLNGYAWTQEEGGCLDDNGTSVYNQWIISESPLIRKHNARKIVSACNRALKELK